MTRSTRSVKLSKSSIESKAIFAKKSHSTSSGLWKLVRTAGCVIVVGFPRGGNARIRTPVRGRDLAAVPSPSARRPRQRHNFRLRANALVLRDFTLRGVGCAARLENVNGSTQEEGCKEERKENRAGRCGTHSGFVQQHDSHDRRS